MTEEIIAVVLIALIIGGAILYIIKAKKNGKKCIGCPDGCSCKAKSEGSCKDGEGNCCCCNKEK